MEGLGALRGLEGFVLQELLDEFVPAVGLDLGEQGCRQRLADRASVGAVGAGVGGGQDVIQRGEDSLVGRSRGAVAAVMGVVPGADDGLPVAGGGRPCEELGGDQAPDQLGVHRTLRKTGLGDLAFAAAGASFL